MGKNGTAIRESAYFNQGIRNMWTPNRSTFRSKSTHLLPRDWVVFCEPFNNFLRARETRLSGSTLHCKQGLVRRIGKVSQKVNGDPLTRAGQLHPAHQGHASSLNAGSGLVPASVGVVIGQPHDIQMRLARLLHEFGGGIGSV